MTEDVAAINSGISELKARFKLKISRANTTPVIGALNIDATAAAVAQPMRSIRSFSLRRKKRPMLEPIAAPVLTVGPSNPTEPPSPTVMGAVMSALYILDGAMSPFRLEMACSVIPIPYLMLPLKNHFLIK